VEDEPTRVLLNELGCDLCQGWHISHAVPHDRIPTLVAERREGAQPVDQSSSGLV
jgi:EAL domain-containing protein (putative c-di-GMP-specific phosphodiesterase class I)